MSRLPSKRRCPFLHQLIGKACSLCSERELWDRSGLFPSLPPTQRKSPPGPPAAQRLPMGCQQRAVRVPFLGARFGDRGLKDAGRAAKAARGGTWHLGRSQPRRRLGRWFCFRGEGRGRRAEGNPPACFQLHKPE